MVTSPISLCNKIAGLTLIEVLIALAIVSIAMTAIIKAVAQTIRANDYLNNKTVAIYVGQQVLNAARIGMLKLPENTNKLSEKTVMLNKDWCWQIEETGTSNQRIKKMHVSVFQQSCEEDTPVISMESYAYHQ